MLRHASAFALGAQAVNPKAKLKLVFTNSWIDQAKDKKGAEALHAAGADVLAQNVDSTAIGQYAQSVGVPWVGYNADARKFAPTSWLTAAIYNWGVYYVPRVKAAIDGTWKTGFYYGNIKDRLHRSRAVRAEGELGYEGQDRSEAQAADRRHVPRLRGAALRPEREASRAEGEDADGKGALRDQLAREGRDREREGIEDRSTND